MTGIAKPPRALSPPFIAAAFVFLVALVLRVAWWAYAQPTPWSDYEDFRRLAELLLEHQQFGYPEPSGRRLPGQPVWLAGMMLVSHSIAWLSLSQVLLSSALVLIVFGVARQLSLGSTHAATGAGLATALSPTFIAFSPVLASEHLFALLVFGTLLIVLKTPPGSIGRGAAAGVIAGASVLTRGESIFYLPVFAGLLLLGGGTFRRRTVLVAAFTVASLCVVTPWYMRNHRVLGPGAGLSTNGGLLFYYAHNENRYGSPNRKGTPLDGVSDVAAQTRGYELGMAYLRQQPTRIFPNMVQGTKRLYRPNAYAIEANLRSPRKGQEEWPERPLAGKDLFSAAAIGYYAGSLLLAAVGTLMLFRYPLRTWFPVVGILFANWFCFSVVFMGAGRYRFVAEVILCGLAGAILATMISRFRRSRSAAITPAAAL